MGEEGAEGALGKIWRIWVNGSNCEQPGRELASAPPAGSIKHTPGGGQGRVIGGWWCSVTLEHPQSKPLALKEPWGPQKLLPTAGHRQEGGAPDLRCAPGYASPKPCPGTPWPTSPFEAPGSIPPETPQKRLLWAPPDRRKNLFTSFSPPFHLLSTPFILHLPAEDAEGRKAPGTGCPRPRARPRCVTGSLAPSRGREQQPLIPYFAFCRGRKRGERGRTGDLRSPERALTRPPTLRGISHPWGKT